MIINQNHMKLQTSKANGFIEAGITDTHCNSDFTIYSIDISYKTSGFSSTGSGGSASGDSIVTQEGTEVTVGDDDVTNTTLKGHVELSRASGTSRITTVPNNTSPSTLSWNAHFGANGTSNGDGGVLLGSITGNTPFVASARRGNGTYGHLRFYTSDINRMQIDANGRVDIYESLYVNGSPKSVDSMLVDLEKDGKLKDKLIEKLSARLDKLEKKLK
jgi:hypothetical protein